MVFASSFNVIQENILNKDLILIDDSIVRGNTLNALVKLLKDAGRPVSARTHHLSSNQTPLFYGELIWELMLN